MKIGRIVACCAVCVCLVVAAFAQDAPKPGAEHAKLGFWVGEWKTETTVLENPVMPAGKTTGIDRCEWFEGKFAVVCRSDGNGPMGRVKGIGIHSYLPEEKAYTYYGVDNMGMTMSEVPKGTVDGNTWTYTDESMMGGQAVKSRYVIEVTSPESYTFKWEMQGEGGKWMTLMTGKGTKRT